MADRPDRTDAAPPDQASPSGGAPRVTTTGGAELHVHDDYVVKVHHPRTDPPSLRKRVVMSAQRACAAYLLAPITTEVRQRPDGRLVTSWPRVEVLDPADEGLLGPDRDGHSSRPAETAADGLWRIAARLLAGLHLVDLGDLGAAVPGSLPRQGGPARLHRALARLHRLREQWPAQRATIAEVSAAGRRVADEWHSDAAASRPPHRTAGTAWALVHGDWHLGQLGRLPEPSPGDPLGGWRLLDIDDLGVGDPAWDLGRPAGFWAAGLLTDQEWATFLDAYRVAGGPAVPQGDPWPALDLPARAAVVVAATRELGRGVDPHSDDTLAALVTACRAMRG